MMSWRAMCLTRVGDGTGAGETGDIVIEDSVWIGAMAIVLPGTRVST